MFTGVLDFDATLLKSATAEMEARLLSMPARRDRDAVTMRDAETLHETARDLRTKFMRLHAEAVYDHLTAMRTRMMRIDELIDLAGQQFGGLTPSADLLLAERERCQKEKEGWDVDLGIVMRGFLSVPSIGTHLIDAMLMPMAGAIELLDDFRKDGFVNLDSVLIKRQGNAAYVTLNRPDVLNAENHQLLRDLELAVDLALLDDEVRVGVLRGGQMRHQKYRGKRVFCAGIDLRALCAGQISLIDFFLSRELGLLNKLRRGVLVRAEATGQDRFSDKPWVGVVETFAIGGGMQLLLSLDYVIAEEGAYVCLPAANDGIVPGAANLRLTRYFGSRLAREIVFIGAKVQTSDSESRLLFNKVCASDDVQRSIESAIALLTLPAVGAGRVMLNLAEEPIDDFRAYIAEFAVTQARRSLSKDVTSKLEEQWAASRRQRFVDATS